MKITRTTDRALINRLVAGSGQGVVDLGALPEDPRCCALIGEPPLGTHISLRIVEGVHEFHTAVLPEGHGEWAVAFAEASLRFMFCTTDCIELLTRIPQGSLAAASLARRFGFMPRWVGGDMVYRNRIVSYAVWSLTMMEWMPAEEAVFAQILTEMQQAGQQEKAMVWHIRRAFVSRKVDA